MVTKVLTYKIGADYGDLRRGMEAQGSITRKQRQELDALVRKQQEHRKALTDLGVGMLTFGAAAAVGMGLAVREAIRWESAFAGVRKTVDGSDEEIAALEGELRQLARTLPATHEEIAAVAEAAGQLGIKREDIAEFTETMVALGETTNLSAEEAATALAKFSNIMGTSASDVDRLGSTLVALGNAGASTEKDIIEMGLRIAGAGKQVGMTEAEVLSFASSLSSVGIEAEAGGSAFSRVMIDIATAVNDGGSKLEQFARIAGMSTSKFSTMFKKDAAGAIQAFIAGLGRMQSSGQDVFGTLDALGLSEIRVRDALLRASGASDIFAASLRTGNRAWAENAALAEEASKRYATTEAQLQIAANNVKDAAIDIGAALLPVLQGGIDVVRNLITAFQNLPGPLKTAVSVLGAVTAGVALLGGAALVATPKLLAFRAAMNNLVASGGKMSGAMGKFGLFMSGPWGLAIAGAVTLLGVFAASMGAAQRRQEEFAEAGKTVAKAIIEQNGVINDAVRADTAKALAEQGLLQNAKNLGVELPMVTDAVLGQGDAYDLLKGQLESAIAAKEAEKRQSQDRSGKEQDRLQGEIDAYQGLLDGVNGARTGKEEELLANEAAADGSKKSAEANRDNAEATQEVALSAEEAAAALQGMIEALDRINGVTLSHREAQRSLVQTVAEARAVFAENAKTLNIHTKAGFENSEQLDKVARAMNDAAEAASREAESTGGAAAGQKALVGSLQASRQQLFNIARQFFKSEKATWDYVDSVLAIPDEARTQISTPGSRTARQELIDVRNKVKDIPPKKSVNVGVLSAAAIQKLKDLGFKVRTLPDGSVVVRANTGGAQGALNAFIARNAGRTVPVNIVTRVSGPRQVGGHYFYARGGIVKAFADGGTEHHPPMVARAKPGTFRMWAEPETGGESYIPWAMDRRGRATKVLGMTADAFGYALVPKSSIGRYAYGGVNGNGGNGPSLSQMLGGCDVNVYIGGQRIDERVDVRIVEHNRQTRRGIGQGVGKAR